MFKKKRVSIEGLDEEAYLKANSDIQIAITKGNFQSVDEHFTLFGFDEIKTGKRRFHVDFTPFDEKLYLQIFPNLSNPYEHFCQTGYQEIIKGQIVWKRVTSMPKIVEHKVIEEIDIAFYQNLYHDLKELSEEALIRHWTLYGKKERRFAFFSDLLDFYNIDKKVLEDFDFLFYTTYYVDLKDKTTTRYQAIHHYLEYGMKENRFINLDSLIVSRDFDVKLISKYISDDFLNRLKVLNSIEIDYTLFVDNITGVGFVPIKVSSQSHINSAFYSAVAENFLIKSKIGEADNYLNIALFFDRTDKALEYKGNLNLEVGEYTYASKYYEEALKLNNQKKYLYLNLAKCYKALHEIKNACEIMVASIVNQVTFGNQNIQMLEEFLKNYFEKLQFQYLNDHIINKDRELLLEKINELSSYVYNTYFKLYGGFEKKENYNSINKNRVLIIGDYHVQQCVRYRIEQKIEQLEYQGLEVKDINWTELHTYQDEIPFYDIVIFYRVPSTVEVLKAVAKVNALNKISIYEIDDFLFEPIYPDSIESYGGSIGMDTYYGLVLGMTKFNAVAKLCDYGIASTLPLQTKLEKLVSKQKCLLHRNGLDKYSVFEKVNKASKTTVDLFYGSGTLAHNADFIDLVLPAVIRLMHEEKKIRLIIVGHLTLPETFKSEFKERVITLPKVNIKAYYNYLKQADINIAVLHKDEITDTKSELKWFEAGCFEIPSVMSGTQNYLDVIKEGEDGFIVNNSQGWYEKLKMLILDKELRDTVGKNVAERIKEEYSVKTLSKILVDNIYSIVDEKQPKANKRKKIALVNVFFPPQSIGGATRVVADNFELLVDKYSDAYEVCVFTSEVESSEPYKVSLYNYKGARVYKANILHREDMDWHPKDEKMYALFTQFLETEQPDKVHFHCVQRLTASIVEATRDKKIPYIITAHDAWWISDYQFLVDKNDTVYPNGHPDSFYERVLPENITLNMSIERESYLKSLLHDAQYQLTVSESFANIYRQNGIENIEVTKNGISSKREWLPKETSYSPKVVCGHIGGMSSHKGYDILKNAVLEVQPQNIAFLIVDHAKEEGYISKDRWGKIDITFIGRQNQENIVSLYGKIDVLFAPSIWPESFGLVTREANGCGCWVVASNLGGVGEDVLEGENGFVIDPTQKALEKTLQKIDSDYQIYKTVAKKGSISMVEEQVEKLKAFLDD